MLGFARPAFASTFGILTVPQGSSALRLRGHSTSALGSACALSSCSSATPTTSTRFHSWGSSVRRFHVIDCHAEGEPARVVLGGLPHVPGDTMNKKRLRMMEPDMDAIRKLLLREPRGYPCQNVDYVLPPSGAHPGAAFGVVIGEQNCIYPAMSGHNIICVATALLETGMVPMAEPVTHFQLETPAGLVGICAECTCGKATRVTLQNVPSFCRPADMDVEIDVPGGIGKVILDVAYGGMFYAIVDAASVGLQISPDNGKELCRVGEMIKVACREQHPVNHPEFDYPGCDILVFTEDRRRKGNALHARNTVVMSNGQLDWGRPSTWTGMIDRSPCGTGSCAVMASLYMRGELALGEDFVHESIVGTTFTGRLIEETVVGVNGGENQGNDVLAVVPTISGRAWVTQHCEVLCDPSDPFPEGYTVGDIWAAGA